MENMVDWLISGSIGLVFGLFSAWVAYRFQRRRDDIAWAREKLKLQEQFAHEKELLERQFQDRAEKLKESELRESLTRGVDNAEKEIKALVSSINFISSSGGHLSPVSANELRRLASELAARVGDVRSVIFAIDSQMSGVRITRGAHLTEDAARWNVKRSGLIMNLQDAVAASRIIQDMADNIDAGGGVE